MLFICSFNPRPLLPLSHYSKYKLCRRYEHDYDFTYTRVTGTVNTRQKNHDQLNSSRMKNGEVIVSPE